MAAFWNELDILGKILFCCGFAGSVMLFVQVVLMIIGFAGGSLGDMGDVNGDLPDDVTDGHTDGAEVGLFTLKGVIAFFAIGGWCGLGANMGGLHIACVLVITIATGTVSLLGVGALYRLLFKLQCSGTMQLSNAIGKTAEVYLTIPAEEKGAGKINLNLQERYTEVDARTKCSRDLKTGEIVKVVDKEGDFVIVEPVINN